MCTPKLCHTTSHIFLPSVSPPLCQLRRPSLFIRHPLMQLVFLSFFHPLISVSPVSLQTLSISELLYMDFCCCSACWPPSVSNQSAIKIHRHSPHGPANSVVHQLTYKPAFLKMYEKCILPNCNWDTGSLIVSFHQNCRGFMPKLSGS